MFSVLVVDEAGQSSSASVVVEIYEERDDPPKAIATECGKSETGSITLRLPLEKIYLCGNSSTDDKVLLVGENTSIFRNYIIQLSFIFDETYYFVRPNSSSNL